jgi:hypothetical protein
MQIKLTYTLHTRAHTHTPGAVGFLNTVAVGAVSVICKAATSIGDSLDRALLASPLGEASVIAAAHVVGK